MEGGGGEGGERGEVGGWIRGGRKEERWVRRCIVISTCLSLQRDLRDIGCYIKVIDGCQQLDKETRYLQCVCHTQWLWDILESLIVCCHGSRSL